MNIKKIYWALLSGGGLTPEQEIANDFSDRVIADSGTVESIDCVTSGVENIYDVGSWDKFSYLLIPSALKTSKIYNVKPDSSDLVYTRSGVRNRVNNLGIQESLAANIAALDYYESSCPALLLEPARTNLFLNSETLTTQDITVTAAAHVISFYGTGSITLSGAHSATINGSGANTRVYLVFTPSSGTLTCTVSGNVKYANAELGAFPTSWITTTVATASRTADAISDLTGISSLIGQTEGALYLEFDTFDDSSTKQISLSDGTANNRITITAAGTTLSGTIQNAGVAQASLSTTLTANTRYRVMLTYRSNLVILFVNGVEASRDTAATIPTCSAISFKRNSGSSNNPFYGRIYKLGVANQVIYNAEAERITGVVNPSTFNIDTDFNTLNLQGSDVNGTDLGVEISLNTYSIFIVAKATSVPVSRQILLGGTSASDFISMEEQATQTRLLKINNVSSGGVDRNFRLWGEEYYEVIAIRRNTSTIYAQTNNRELITLDGSSDSNVTKIGHVGKASDGSNPFIGTIRAVCISSTYLSNDDTEKAIDDLFTRYNLPETSDAIVGFGDSITFGSAASNRLTTAWLPLLAGALSKPFKNFGISGSSLSGATGDGGLARYGRQIAERPYSDTICILYGTNDVTGGVSSTVYQYALENIVKGLLLYGYTPNKIIIGTIPYQLSDANAATIATYNTVITNVCTLFGLNSPANIYDAMKNGGGDSIMDDTVHPDNTGHQIIADTFENVING